LSLELEGSSEESPGRAGNPQHRRNRSEEKRRVGKKLYHLLIGEGIISPRRRIENKPARTFLGISSPFIQLTRSPSPA